MRFLNPKALQYTALLLLYLVFHPLAANAAKQAQNNVGQSYQSIEWTDLMPEDDLQALLDPPAYLDEIEDGSPEDQLRSQLSPPESVEPELGAPSVSKDQLPLAAEIAKASADAKDIRYQQALVSKRVRPEFDGAKIKLPGYIVPLSFDDNMVITEFFLVPFFGACIHVPPPPPNQMIYISYKKGLKLESLYDPFLVEGTLVIKEHSNEEMGTASYSLVIDSIYPYTD